MSDYDFGRQEPGGLLHTGVSWAELLTMVLGIGFAVGLMVTVLPITGPGRLVFILILAAAPIYFARTPVAGKTVVEWSPIMFRSLRGPRIWTRGARRRQSHLVDSRDLAGAPVPPPADPPPAFEHLEWIDAQITDDDLVGVIVDKRRDTYTGVMQCQISDHRLLGDEVLRARIDLLGEALRHTARENTPVAAIQWLEGTQVVDAHALARHFQTTRDPSLPIRGQINASYLEAIQQVADGVNVDAQEHTMLVAVTISAKRAGASIKSSAGGQGKLAGACNVLVQEMRALAGGLERAGITVSGALLTEHLHTIVRETFDPMSRREMQDRALRDPDHSGVADHDMYPLRTEYTIDSYITDGTHHCTLHIAELPRTSVGPRFLEPLVLNTPFRRLISGTLEPVPPSEARRELQSARVTQRTMPTFINRDLNEQDDQEAGELDSHALDLVLNYGDFRYSGYVTVSASSREELEQAIYDATSAAAQSGGMVLRVEYWQQPDAFTYTLPLGRGVK